MDLNNILRGLMPTMTHNTTDQLTTGASTASSFSSNSSSSPDSTKMLEGLLPMLGLRGLTPVYGFVGNWLGIDPGIMLTFLGIVWALQKIGQQLYNLSKILVTQYLMSSIHIASTDDIHIHLMKWLATQPRMTSSRSLMVETASKTAWEDEIDASTVARDRSGRYLNFSNQEARAPPLFVPAMGRHTFWWQGQLFTLNRKQNTLFDDGASSGSMTFKDKEDMVISCLWRSPEPIKRLLQHAKDCYYKDHQARTVVKRPYPTQLRRWARNSWQVVANRPVRDMRTVVLDNRQKAQILADMNEYLHPSTPRWYANRGIPLRRGYLFHGPPGTGKTSLSFALAGVFGLDIHVISLLEPTLTEEDLSNLLGGLPRRCIVLLEDIDTAGLKRTGDESERERQEKLIGRGRGGGRGGRGGRRTASGKGDKKDGEEEKHEVNGDTTASETKTEGAGKSEISKMDAPNDWKVSDLAKALKSENDDKKQGISLSGLLNAIDGVASHEGRVLIMTTNVPESLDEALIRPGRVDLQVAFSNATTEQAEALFLRMYESDEDSRQSPPAPPAPHSMNGSSKSAPVPGLHKTGSAYDEIFDDEDEEEDHLNVDQLSAVAKDFASKIPGGIFSPAEIQGFLLKRKKHPRKAVREADKWVEALVRQKETHSKVLEVQ